MTEQDKNYKLALEKSGVYLENPEGLVNKDVTQRNDQIRIRQNNTIIILLVQIAKQISDLQTLILDKPSSSKVLENDIEQLTKTLGNLNLSAASTSRVVTEPVVKIFGQINEGIKGPTVDFSK